MNLNFLEFEQPIAELEAKIEELRLVGADSDVNITEEIHKLEDKIWWLDQEAPSFICFLQYIAELKSFQVSTAKLWDNFDTLDGKVFFIDWERQAK